LPVSNRINKFWSTLKSFLFGATTYDMVKSLEERKVLEEYLLMLVTLGDMLGYPTSSYYRLRLLPFWVRTLETWMHFMLSEKDITEKLK